MHPLLDSFYNDPNPSSQFYRVAVEAAGRQGDIKSLVYSPITERFKVELSASLAENDPFYKQVHDFSFAALKDRTYEIPAKSLKQLLISEINGRKQQEASQTILPAEQLEEAVVTQPAVIEKEEPIAAIAEESIVLPATKQETVAATVEEEPAANDLPDTSVIENKQLVRTPRVPSALEERLLPTQHNQPDHRRSALQMKYALQACGKITTLDKCLMVINLTYGDTPTGKYGAGINVPQESFICPIPGALLQPLAEILKEDSDPVLTALRLRKSKKVTFNMLTQAPEVAAAISDYVESLGEAGALQFHDDFDAIIKANDRRVKSTNRV